MADLRHQSPQQRKRAGLPASVHDERPYTGPEDTVPENDPGVPGMIETASGALIPKSPSDYFTDAMLTKAERKWK